MFMSLVSLSTNIVLIVIHLAGMIYLLLSLYAVYLHNIAGNITVHQNRFINEN